MIEAAIYGALLVYLAGAVFMHLLASRGTIRHAVADIGSLLIAIAAASAALAYIASPDAVLAGLLVVSACILGLLAGGAYSVAVRVASGKPVRQVWREKDEAARRRRINRRNIDRHAPG